MARDEQAIENELQAKGLNAPRLSPAHISNTIAGIQFHRFLDTTLVVCCLTLRNGYCVTGESAAASPENFDEGIGKNIAFEKARDKIWGLEGYLLRERLAAKANPPNTVAQNQEAPHGESDRRSP